MEPEGEPVLWGRKPQAMSAGAGERAMTIGTEVLQQAPEGQRRLGGAPGFAATSGTDGFVTLAKSLPCSRPGEGGGWASVDSADISGFPAGALVVESFASKRGEAQAVSQ